MRCTSLQKENEGGVLPNTIYAGSLCYRNGVERHNTYETQHKKGKPLIVYYHKVLYIGMLCTLLLRGKTFMQYDADALNTIYFNLTFTDST